MDKPLLGRLEKVQIREIWKNEQTGFTPWLAEAASIKLLGDTIGLELEVVSVEKEVGRFFADILCKETTSDRYVVVENQIERTDHDHLGKTITYAAGLGATAVVWVAKHFTEEHRAAFDWLNEVTRAEVAFFGLEIEAWRIGDSPPAPKFNVVCRPNEFLPIANPDDLALSSTRQAQLDFWLGFKEHMDESSPIKCSKPRPENWMNHPIGRSGIWMSSIMSTWNSLTGKADGGEFRVELSIDDGHPKATLAAMDAQRAAIEADLHTRNVTEDLLWQSKEGVRACRISVRRGDDVLDKQKWPEYREWLRTRLEAFDTVFRPVIENLEVDA
jgi:hypothetical protein